MTDAHDIFDRAAKRCISLSKQGTIMLINGLYEKNYPLDSEVEYHWTEHHDEALKKTLADTIIVLNHTDSYHMEVQMYPDKEIVLRVFEYGYRHAMVRRNGTDILVFPNPRILYLYEDGNAPDYEELLIDFGEQGQFTYKVPTFKYLNIPLEELKRRQLIVLLPFQLLRLRKEIEGKRTPENMEALKDLICHDIIGTITENIAAGNLSVSDGRKLKQITLQLYRHLYKDYKELEKAGVNDMVEDAMVLDIDIIEYEHQKEIERISKELTEKVTEEVTKDVTNKIIKKLHNMGLSEEEIAQITKPE